MVDLIDQLIDCTRVVVILAVKRRTRCLVRIVSQVEDVDEAPLPDLRLVPAAVEVEVVVALVDGTTSQLGTSAHMTTCILVTAKPGTLSRTGFSALKILFFKTEKPVFD